MIKDIHNAKSVFCLGYAYRFVIGKSATPFYYIVVLIQLTVITPWLVKVVREDKKVKNFLWLVTPCYLFYVYVWNFITGEAPPLYETLCPAWFVFYYLGIRFKCGFRLKWSGYMVVIALVVSCVEAFGLKHLGMSMGFYTSQITIGSFLYSFVVIGWLLNEAESKEIKVSWLSRVGDCSYGIFYIHMMVLMLVGQVIHSDNWFVYWGLRFGLTSLISFLVVSIGQKLLQNKKQLMRYIGFI